MYVYKYLLVNYDLGSIRSILLVVSLILKISFLAQ